jgi:Disulphide bond corrector protein DsbC
MSRLMRTGQWCVVAAALVIEVGALQAQPRPLIGNGVKHASARIEPIDVRGKRVRVLVTLRVDPGWHVSWRNPGETGLPTRLSWSLPAGVQAVEETWPVPVITHTPVGDTHTLEGDVPWIIEFRVDSASAVDRLIGLTVKYGVCREVCIPEQLTAQGVLPGGADGRRFVVPATLQARLAVAAGTIAARRLSPTRLCVERIPLQAGQRLPEVVADSGLGLDAALRLTAGRGRGTPHGLATIPATAVLSRGARVLFVSGTSGASAVLDFDRPAPHCSAR